MKFYLTIIFVLIFAIVSFGQQSPQPSAGKLTQQQMHDTGINSYPDGDFKSAISKTFWRITK